MVLSIDELAIENGLHRYFQEDAVVREAIEHNAFAHEKNQVFMHTPFTRSCVDGILSYADLMQVPESSCPYYAVLGKSGTGKTSLMTNAMTELIAR
jgi:hypothetical protein